MSSEPSDNSRNVRLVTDSAAGLPDSVLHTHSVSVARMEINIGDETYLDGIDADPLHIYKELRTNPDVRASVSAPNPSEWLRTIADAAAQGAQSVLCITLSARLSASYDSAKVAAQMATTATMPDIDVKVIDSNAASGAQALIVLQAARNIAEASNDNTDINSVVESIEESKSKVRFLGMLDTLDHIHRSGRVPSPILRTAKMLNIKPVLSYDADGIHLVAKPLYRQGAINRILKELETDITATVAQSSDTDPATYINIMHADALHEAENLRYQIEKRLHSIPHHIQTTVLHPFLGIHAGPGFIGIAWLKQN